MTWGSLDKALGLGVALWLVGCRSPLDAPAGAEANDPGAAWGSLLSEVVDDDGYVDYDLLERHRADLDAYVAWIGRDRAAPKGHRPKLAFLLNAYNALVLFAVLEEGRPASVKDVPSVYGPEGTGFFTRLTFRVGQDRLSLWELEHERIRGRFQDYRVHAALSCASRGCPPLRGELYDGKRLEAQLRDQMHRWIGDERGVRVYPERAEFSPIFDWYAYDFSHWTGGADLCTTASKHATGTRRRRLEALAEAGCPHSFADYDWSLNESR